MGTIKGEIPKEIEERFRKSLSQHQKGSISKALTEAIVLWLEQHEDKEKAKKMTFYHLLLQKYDEDYIILNQETSEVVAVGNEILDAIKEAKEKKSDTKLHIISRQHILPRTAQLGFRSKLILTKKQARG